MGAGVAVLAEAGGGMWKRRVEYGNGGDVKFGVCALENWVAVGGGGGSGSGGGGVGAGRD